MAKCGAKTRSGGKCQRDAMPNGRCNLHGGKSTGAPSGNQNAAKWGFFAKHVMSEQLAIMQEIDEAQPADILWSNILISYSAIIRAQKLMYVESQEDIRKHLRRDKQTENMTEQEWEFQYPWDRHANFMQAQARAQAELRALIKEFLTMADEKDARRLKLEAMQTEIELKKAELEKLKNPGGLESEDDGFIEALNAQVDEVWADDSDDSADEDE